MSKDFALILTAAGKSERFNNGEKGAKKEYSLINGKSIVRMALDAFMNDPDSFVFDPLWMRELCSVSHRQYDTGFFFTPPHENANIVDDMGYIREKAYLATALTDSDENGFAVFIQRNKLVKGDPVELLTPGRTGIAFNADGLYGENGEPIDSTPHPNQLFRLKCPVKVNAGDILRGGDRD